MVFCNDILLYIDNYLYIILILSVSRDEIIELLLTVYVVYTCVRENVPYLWHVLIFKAKRYG